MGGNECPNCAKSAYDGRNCIECGYPGKGSIPTSRAEELLADGFDKMEVIDVLRKEGFSADEVAKARNVKINTYGRKLTWEDIYKFTQVGSSEGSGYNASMVSGPSSILNPGEEAILSSHVSKFSIDGKDMGRSGTLMYTSAGRVLFVTEEGMFNKKYKIDHWCYIGNVTNTRVEKRMIGSALVVEINWEDGHKTHRYEGIADAANWINELNEQVNRKQVALGAAKLLNSKERTSFSDMKRFYKEKTNYDGTDEDVANLLRTLLEAKLIDGFVDEEKKEFVHMTAYKQKTEVVQYNIAASFNFGSNGTLEIKCPHCGGSQELKERVNTVNCKFCGESYLIPDKIRNLL